jgi:hypothetical protein
VLLYETDATETPTGAMTQDATHVYAGFFIGRIVIVNKASGTIERIDLPEGAITGLAVDGSTLYAAQDFGTAEMRGAILRIALD